MYHPCRQFFIPIFSNHSDRIHRIEQISPLRLYQFSFPRESISLFEYQNDKYRCYFKEKKKKNAFIIFPSYLPRAFVSFSREKNAFDILVYVINHTFERKFVILFQFIFRNVSIHVDTVFFLSSHKYRDCYIAL